LATLDEARTARESLGQLLAKNPHMAVCIRCLRGFEYGLEVLVQGESIPENLPDSVDGVPVSYETVESIDGY
jgi:hypothetical protein